MIKESIQEENKTFKILIYTTNRGASRYIKQILKDIKEEIDNNIIVIRNFNTPLMSMDISPRQKINKEIVVFYDTLGQLDLIDTYRTFHLKTTEYTFFSSPCGMFSRINHMLGHKTSLNKFNSIEIISNIFFLTTVV